MKKGMMKRISKVLKHFVVVSLLIGICTTAVAAASFSLSKSKSTVKPGGSFTVTITVNGAGKFGIVGSNATVSTSSIWCENSCRFTVTAGSEGTAKVTVTAQDATGWDETPVTGSKSVSVSVKANSTSSNTNKEPEVKIDDAALKAQIELAEKIKKDEYTSETWKDFDAALKVAKSALTSKNQKTVDDATANLKKAIEGLVKVDRSKLQDAINQANTLIDVEDHEIWSELVTLIVENKGLLVSTDQQAIDEATNKILSTITSLKAFLALYENDITIKEGEEFCNLTLHTVWPILFFISLAMNFAIGYMLLNKSKRRFNDNTPVVDYDITDDNVQ